MQLTRELGQRVIWSINWSFVSISQNNFLNDSIYLRSRWLLSHRRFSLIIKLIDVRMIPTFFGVAELSFLTHSFCCCPENFTKFIAVKMPAFVWLFISDFASNIFSSDQKKAHTFSPNGILGPPLIVFPIKRTNFFGNLRKSQKKSHSTLRAKWTKVNLKIPKTVNFGEFLKTWCLRSNSVTRQVSFNRTKIGGKTKIKKF